MGASKVQIKKNLSTVKDVWISIKGNGPSHDINDDVELITEGKLFIEDGKYMVEYDESQMTGMIGTKTSMSINDGIVTVIRRGKVNSNFVFTNGQRQDSLYETEHGKFQLSIFTNRVDIDFDETGGEVMVEYQIDFMNNVGKNYIHLFVKEVRH